MSRQERLLDLLTARATESLSVEDSRELDLHLHELTDVEAEDLDLAAASAHLAFEATMADPVPMPEGLKRRILVQAFSHSSARREPAGRPGLLGARYLGWYAAAAILLLALWAPWSTGTRRTDPSPSLAEQRATLVESARDLIQVAWARPEDAEYARVRGDVVWSNERQAGFLRISGMPVNRPFTEQYQLWIVDPSRDENPIDGGVFDIPSGVEEVLIPIDAKLRVDDPKVFAITLEKPGGVVVSDGPLLVIAAVKA